jgi:outer membrane protein OmpA-like peptidoglycan-associated protein
MKPSNSNEWMGISDMMSGLMLVFLFIAIGFMVEVQSQKDALVEVAQSYKDTKANINEALYGEFENELEKWDATITADNRVIFNSPEVLFDVSSSEINPKFEAILEQFFPRFVAILSDPKYKDEIVEIRVEGHTSKSWANSTDPQEIYLKNMKLSQDRAYSVLSYCYGLEDDVVQSNRTWLEEYLRANGMAYAMEGEHEEHTRRVEFRVIIKSEDKIDRILE